MAEPSVNIGVSTLGGAVNRPPFVLASTADLSGVFTSLQKHLQCDIKLFHGEKEVLREHTPEKLGLWGNVALTVLKESDMSHHFREKGLELSCTFCNAAYSASSPPHKTPCGHWICVNCAKECTSKATGKGVRCPCHVYRLLSFLKKTPLADLDLMESLESLTAQASVQCKAKGCKNAATIWCKECDLHGNGTLCGTCSEKAHSLFDHHALPLAEHNGMFHRCLKHNRPFSKVISTTVEDGSVSKRLGCMDCEGAGQPVEEFVAELQEQIKTVLAENSLLQKYSEAVNAELELETRFAALAGDTDSAGSIQETCGIIDSFYNELIATINQNREAMKAAVVKEGQSRIASLDRLHSRVLEVASTAHLASCLLEAVDGMKEAPLPLLVKSSNVLDRAQSLHVPTDVCIPPGVIDFCLPSSALDWAKDNTVGTVMEESAVSPSDVSPLSALLAEAIVVQLDVRGSPMEVSLNSLQRHRQSLFYQHTCVFRHEEPVFVDCDPAVMKVLLSSLDVGVLLKLPDGVSYDYMRQEAKRCGLPCLPLSGAAVRELFKISRKLPNLICQPGSRFDGLDLAGFDLSGGDFTECSLAGAKMTCCNLSNSNLSGANLTGADLSGAVLKEANLSGAILVAAKFVRADLSGRDFSGCDLSGADFSHAVLTDVNLSGAKLVGTMLVEVDLSDRDLSGWNLSGANLSGSDLSGAVLKKAILSRCVLTGIDFRRADLSETNWEGAIVANVIAHGAKGSTA